MFVGTVVTNFFFTRFLCMTIPLTVKASSYIGAVIDFTSSPSIRVLAPKVIDKPHRQVPKLLTKILFVQILFFFYFLNLCHYLKIDFAFLLQPKFFIIFFIHVFIYIYNFNIIFIYNRFNDFMFVV